MIVALGLTVAFNIAGLPSAALFGGLVAGLVYALGLTAPIRVPSSAGTAAQAVLGVTVGALVDVETLRAVGENWPVVLLVTVATLALSVATGLVLQLQRGISPVTGVFAMIAGGASGITAMARDLGADDRMVAVLQYLRVLLIVVLMPVVAATVYGASAGAGTALAPPVPQGPGWPADLLFTAACAVVGLVVARLARVPVASLLGPMLAAAVAVLAGISDGATVPDALANAAFLVIGLQVGVSFTRSSLRLIGRAMPLALVLILALIVACAGLGVLLSEVAGVSPLVGYLATTPGGLYAVLATATDSGADAVFVLAVQVLRLFVMLLGAPLIAAWLRADRA